MGGPDPHREARQKFNKRKLTVLRKLRELVALCDANYCI